MMLLSEGISLPLLGAPCGLFPRVMAAGFDPPAGYFRFSDQLGRWHVIQASGAMTNERLQHASEELIRRSEAELAVEFPEEFKAIWRTHNCNELPGGWRFYPIFDPSNPRKTAGSITYENLRGVWGIRIRSSGLLALASNGTGNHLVARVVDGRVEPRIFHWHHDTGKLSHWKPGVAAVMKSARESVEALARIRARFPGRA
jgi:hypothetical protein